MGIFTHNSFTGLLVETAPVVTPFVRVGTYLTRNFATLDRYSYGRRLLGLRFTASLAMTDP